MKGYTTYRLTTDDISTLWKNATQPMLGSYIFDLTDSSALSDKELVWALGAMTVACHSIETGSLFVKLHDDWSLQKIPSMMVPGLVRMGETHVRNFAVISDSDTKVPDIKSHILTDIPSEPPTTIPWIIRFLDFFWK